MHSSIILKTSLLLGVFLQTSASCRADGEKEAEALRKEIQALLAEAQSLAKLLRAEKQNLEARLQEKTREINELREARLQAEVQTKAFKARVLELEAQVRELSRKLARAKAGLPPMKDPPPAKDRNFPAAKIEGRILEVDKEGKLFKLSIGSDAGLAKGHNLNIYRLDPIPEKSVYLGVLEVVSVQPTQAVARMTRPLPAGKVIQVGDTVASKLFDSDK